MIGPPVTGVPRTRAVASGQASVGLLERIRLFGRQVADEAHQRRGWVTARREPLAHDAGAVLVPGYCRLVPVSAAVIGSSQPALLAEVVHHRHHRRVGDGPIPPQVFGYVPNRYRAVAIPDTAHYPRLKLAEHPHPDSSRTVEKSTTRIVLRL